MEAVVAGEEEEEIAQLLVVEGSGKELEIV